MRLPPGRSAGTTKKGSACTRRMSANSNMRSYGKAQLEWEKEQLANPNPPTAKANLSRSGAMTGADDDDTIENKLWHELKAAREEIGLGHDWAIEAPPTPSRGASLRVQDNTETTPLTTPAVQVRGGRASAIGTQAYM